MHCDISCAITLRESRRCFDVAPDWPPAHLEMSAGVLQQERPCRLAGLCGQSLSHRATPKGVSATPTFAQVQKNPMLAMKNVLSVCKSG